MADAAVAEKAPEAKRERRALRLRRWLPRISALVGVLVALLWWAIHRFDWMGPLVANSLRAVIGVDAVAFIEDTVYAIEDRYNRFSRKQEAPKAHWVVPSVKPPAAPAPSSAAPGKPELAPFAPKDPGPALKSWSAPGDGVWVPIVDPRRPAEAPHMMKTLLHPDVNRGWAEVFVVAVDLRRVTLHLLPGTQEPKADNPAGEKIARPGVIPESAHEELLAAFNGGFMTEHGGYGMKLDGVTIVSPKPKACTLAVYPDQSMRIGRWTDVEATEKEMLWYRQAPECMYRQDKLHPGLEYQSGVKKWGATLDGETVIRRSGIGLNATRDILYVAITNHSTARVLADGMHHAGASDVAQLDVNWSYPKFVLFEPKTPGGPRKAVALADGFEFSEDEYIRKKARRDFFYLMRKPAP
jgi:hypothetical protein